MSFLAVICVIAAVAPTRLAFAQTTTWSVSSGTDLAEALTAAFQNNVADLSLVNTITLGASISGSSQWIVSANVNIVGNGYTITMNNADRAFFVAGGAVTMSNLTIANGRAAGGDATVGAGAGAGLGGAILVGSGTYATGNGSPAILGLSTPAVVLQDVSFQSNKAIGGRAFITRNSQPWGGGGGGLGGTGGFAGQAGQVTPGSGGGGGLAGGRGYFQNDTRPNGGGDGGFGGGGGSAWYGGAGGARALDDRHGSHRPCRRRHPPAAAKAGRDLI